MEAWLKRVNVTLNVMKLGVVHIINISMIDVIK